MSRPVIRLKSNDAHVIKGNHSYSHSLPDNKSVCPLYVCPSNTSDRKGITFLSFVFDGALLEGWKVISTLSNLLYLPTFQKCPFIMNKEPAVSIEEVYSTLALY